jgi:hypothetical protein
MVWSVALYVIIRIVAYCFFTEKARLSTFCREILNILFLSYKLWVVWEFSLALDQKKLDLLNNTKEKIDYKYNGF